MSSPRLCRRCDKPLTGRKTMWCNSACRNAVKKRGGTVLHLPSSEGSNPAGLASAFRAMLSTAGRLDTPLGQLALSHAALLDESQAVMGRAALAKELRDTFVEAMKDADRDASTLDEINESAAAALKLIRSAGA
jgi:hypothetical protein